VELGPHEILGVKVREISDRSKGTSRMKVVAILTCGGADGPPRGAIPKIRENWVLPLSC